MINFTKPTNLNGSELIAELDKIGVPVKGFPVIDENGAFWLDIAETDKAKAVPVIAAHNGTMIAPEPTLDQKLASVGLSIDDLKAALGL